MTARKISSFSAKVLGGVLAVWPGLSASAQDARPTEGAYTCYFGVLHSHTVLSPDFAPQPADRAAFVAAVGGTESDRFAIPNGPMQAWTVAADDAKIDFLALTDHVHGPETGQPEFSDDEMPEGGYRLLQDAAALFNASPARAGKFLAIPGMEWSTISSGNHINILFAKNFVPSAIKNGSFSDLLTQYLNNPVFEQNNPLLLVQMNHPNDLAVPKNYGRADFTAGATGDQSFNARFGETYLAVEHINSSSNGGIANALAINSHRDGDGLESFYQTYLNMGFRVAPLGDHDNHRANWGRATAARSGVWSKDLTAESFVEAYKARRIFATEDNELSVVYKTGDHWMGEIVELSADAGDQMFQVRVDQMADTDTGVVENEGPYIVELWGDDDGPGGPLVKRLSVQQNGMQMDFLTVPQGERAEFSRAVKPGGYYYLHVRETNSTDGQGSNSDAWTAPIWFKSP